MTITFRSSGQQSMIASYTTLFYINSAAFSSPTILGQIVIGSIVGTYSSFNITRTGGSQGTFTASNQTGSSYTDPNTLTNNTQYTYTITPTNGSIIGKPFTAITNPNNSGTKGSIYTLANVSGLNPTYSGANSTVSSVYITWNNNDYSTLYLANTTNTGVNYTASGTAYNSSTAGSNDSSLSTNTQYIYTFTTINGDGYYVANSNCQTTVNTCTWASAPSLSYNGSGSTTTAISFTFSSGTYSNLSVQYPNGTQVTTTTSSPYTGGSFSANQQVTYYVYPINALLYTSSNGSSVSVCTWGTCNSPTFSSTTATGTTLADSGTFSKVYITYSGTGSPGSGTTVTGTNSINQAYTSMSSSTNYTFNCYPVNNLNYQSSNVASASVTTSSSGPNYILIADGTSTTDWTTSYGTFTSDSGFGNPAPSFKGTSNMTYINIVSKISGFTTFWGRIIKFDAWAPTNGLVNVWIGCNSTGGGGSVFRVDGRSGYRSGINTTTATVAPWSNGNFGGTTWSTSTGPQLTGGTWYSIILTIDANGSASWTYNGTAWNGTSYTINNGGTYFAFEPESATGYIDNIYIS